MFTREWLRRKTGRRVLVQTTDENSIEGVLLCSAPDGLILQAAAFLGETGGTVALAGETFVPRARVRFLQLLPPKEVE